MKKLVATVIVIICMVGTSTLVNPETMISNSYTSVNQVDGVASFPGMNFQKGMSYAAWWNDIYATSDSDLSLENLDNTGTEWVSLVTTWYQDDEYSTQIYEDLDRTPSDESVIHAIETIHSLGMHVMLKPHVDLQNGEWRGEIQFDAEADWEEWFNSYRNFICHYAQLAENHNVEQFCIGCEDVKTTQREEWFEVIDAVRKNFSGPITYAADWSNYQNVIFWEELDFVGIDAYFQLTGKNNPSVEELIEAWVPWEKEIEKIHNNTNKNIIFTEIGYRSINGCNKDPWNWWRVGSLDLQEQADCYKAVFNVFYDKEWFNGIYWWTWDSDPDVGGHTDRHYTPFRKPAGDILEIYYSENLSINFNKPQKGTLYIFDREIMPTPIDTTVIGRISIKANSNGDTVEFYIDGELKYVDEEMPFGWIWDDFVTGGHEVKVIAYDNKENTATDEIEVIIFNLWAEER